MNKKTEQSPGGVAGRVIQRYSRTYRPLDEDTERFVRNSPKETQALWVMQRESSAEAQTLLSEWEKEQDAALPWGDIWMRLEYMQNGAAILAKRLGLDLKENTNEQED